jgi:hypothetical protein
VFDLSIFYLILFLKVRLSSIHETCEVACNGAIESCKELSLQT